MMKVVILAAGDFPKSEYPIGILKSADKIVCCDSAADALVEFGAIPDYIIGDLDSVSEETRAKMADRLILNNDQETNDLTKAFEFALTHSPSEIHILGATGKREDHTLGNISLLADYVLMTSAAIDMITDYGKFVVINSNASIPCKTGIEISLFSFDNTLKIHTEGLQYPTDDVVFDTLWKATLNKALSDSFSVEMNHPAPLIIFLERN